jgi:probable LLM family oxidoreductase
VPAGGRLFQAGPIAGGRAEVDSVGHLPQQRVQLVLLFWFERRQELLLGLGDRLTGLPQDIGTGRRERQHVASAVGLVAAAIDEATIDELEDGRRQVAGVEGERGGQFALAGAAEVLQLDEDEVLLRAEAEGADRSANASGGVTAEPGQDRGELRRCTHRAHLSRIGDLRLNTIMVDYQHGKEPLYAEGALRNMAGRAYEFGLDTFMAVTADADGNAISGDQVVRNTVQEGVLAEQVGIDSFNIGEHYRDDMMDSAAHVVLGAIAGRTETIRLGTAVTVLSTQDPVRLYNNFATLDAVSGGRAQLVVGRGSAVESFPLFGYDLREYEEVFEEKLGLFVQLLRGEPVTWSGKYRAALDGQVLTPPLPAGNLPTWVGSGGSPESVIRAARFGLPLMLAVIGGQPDRFRPLVDLYRRALAQYGQPALPVGLHTLAYVAGTDEEAIETQWPYWLETFDRASRERGWRRPTRGQFESEVNSGAMFVGSPETVAQRLASAMRALDVDRIDLHYALGKVPFEKRMQSIELLGRQVYPRIRELLATDPFELDTEVVGNGALSDVASPVRSTHAPARG